MKADQLKVKRTTLSYVLYADDELVKGQLKVAQTLEEMLGFIYEYWTEEFDEERGLGMFDDGGKA